MILWVLVLLWASAVLASHPTAAAQVTAEVNARDPLLALPVIGAALRGIHVWLCVTELGGLFIWFSLNWRRFWPVIAPWED